MSATASPIINPSPKARFMESGQSISKHREMVQSNEVQRALDYGLLEFQRQVLDGLTNLNEAAGAALRIQGALQFAHLLKTLAESVRAPSIVPSGNLDHAV